MNLGDGVKFEFGFEDVIIAPYVQDVTIGMLRLDFTFGDLTVAP